MWNRAEFQKRLRVRLAELNITQAELAKRAKTSAPCISNWLTGKTEPSLDVLARVAAALKTTVAQLLGDDSVGEQSSHENKPVRNARRVPA